MTNLKQCKSSEMLTRTKIVTNLRSSTVLDKLPNLTSESFDNFPDFKSSASGFIDMKSKVSVKLNR